MTVKYLAIDPGHMCGWATADEKGDIAAFGQFHMDNLLPFLTDLLDSNPEIEQIVTEDYRNTSKFRQKTGSRNETSKVIGKIELLAEQRSIPMTLQSNQKYNIGAKWGGFEIPTNHSISHQWVAAAHLIYWLQSNGVREPGRAMP